MDVILLEKVHKLGNLGDKIAVNAGYGRNFLIPYGKAAPATKENLAEFEVRRAELEKKADEALHAAQQRASAMENLAVVVEVRASEEGKLFGSVGTKDIAHVISATGVDVQKSEIRMPAGVIRELGEYDIEVELHSDIVVSVKVQVVPKARA